MTELEALQKDIVFLIKYVKNLAETMKMCNEANMKTNIIIRELIDEIRKAIK